MHIYTFNIGASNSYGYMHLGTSKSLKSHSRSRAFIEVAKLDPSIPTVISLIYTQNLMPHCKFEGLIRRHHLGLESLWNR